MGYGYNNTGTAMHPISRGGRHFELSEEQLATQARVRAYLAEQKEEQAKLRSQQKAEAFRRFIEKPFAWEKISLSLREKNYLRDAEKVYTINRSIIQTLSQAAEPRINDLFQPSALIGKFNVLRWEQWDSNYDYITAQMRLKGDGIYAFLNVNVSEIIIDKYNSGVQIFFRTTSDADEIKIDGFEIVSCDGHRSYILRDDDVKHVVSMQTQTQGQFIASLINKLAVRFSRAMLNQKRIRRFDFDLMYEMPSQNLTYDNHIDCLCRNYVEHCPCVIKEFIRKTWTVDRILAELDKKFWYYRFIEKFLYSSGNKIYLRNTGE